MLSVSSRFSLQLRINGRYRREVIYQICRTIKCGRKPGNWCFNLITWRSSLILSGTVHWSAVSETESEDRMRSLVCRRRVINLWLLRAPAIFFHWLLLLPAWEIRITQSRYKVFKEQHTGTIPASILLPSQEASWCNYSRFYSRLPIYPTERSCVWCCVSYVQLLWEKKRKMNYIDGFLLDLVYFIW